MRDKTLLLCAVFLLFTVNHLLADTPREIAKRVSPSVVLLVMEDSNGQPLAMASGFLIRDGIVATTLHVIQGAASGYAKLSDQKEKYTVKGVVATDAARDLVFLSVAAMKATPLPLGDSKQVVTGDEIYAVGNPQGLEGTFSAGIVSGLRKMGDDSLLQITAPISPGSSGGPVVNAKGEVIGVSVATFKDGQNLNFAIPSQYVSALLLSIKPAISLAEATKAVKDKKEKSILDDMGGRSTEGVVGSDFLWALPGNRFDGSYSFTLRNKLRTGVKDVLCLVVFHNDKGEVLDINLIGSKGGIPAGLARRITGKVDGSVKTITSGNADAPTTKLEYRIIYFALIDPGTTGIDEPASKPNDDTSHKKQEPASKPAVGSAGGQNNVQDRLKKAQEELAKSEAELAAAVAKVAPAGDGPDLIESAIDGEFNGWEGETIFKLSNGQIWQQVTYSYTYHYAYQPKVFIIKTHGAYKMKVEGVSGTIFVKRLK